jgi:hypothetical protein
VLVFGSSGCLNWTPQIPNLGKFQGHL